MGVYQVIRIKNCYERALSIFQCLNKCNYKNYLEAVVHLIKFHQNSTPRMTSSRSRNDRALKAVNWYRNGSIVYYSIIHNTHSNAVLKSLPI